MRVHLRCAYLICATALVSSTSTSAAVMLTNTSYSQNFDVPNLSDIAVGSFPAGGAKAAIPGSSAWDGAKIDGSTSAMSYAIQDGSSGTGALTSFGATGSTERALGAISSNSTTPGFGVEFTNGLGSPITQVTIRYLGEFWRSPSFENNSFLFGYSVGVPGETMYIDNPGTNVPALNLNGPAFTASNVVLNGNVDPNRATFMATFDVDVPVGQSLYLRWQDVNNSGNDAGLAVDDFELTAVTVPEPATLSLVALAASLAVCVSRRR